MNESLEKELKKFKEISSKDNLKLDSSTIDSNINFYEK